MALDFFGVDPETPNGGSPMVWLDTEKREFVYQGTNADTALNNEISTVEWVPGHEIGIPSHESVVRLPVRMIHIIREACDAAERAGLLEPAERSEEDSGPPGDA